jgi:hypothetical protein
MPDRRKTLEARDIMIKAITQYVVVCDNPFCDSTVRFGVDHHSYDRREQFKAKIRTRGWTGTEDDEDQAFHVCPSCRDFSAGLPSFTLLRNQVAS